MKFSQSNISLEKEIQPNAFFWTYSSVSAFRLESIKRTNSIAIIFSHLTLISLKFLLDFCQSLFQMAIEHKSHIQAYFIIHFMTVC